MVQILASLGHFTIWVNCYISRLSEQNEVKFWTCMTFEFQFEPFMDNQVN